MILRLTPRALAEAKRIKTWWRGHRLAALPVLTKSGFAALFLTALDPLVTFAWTVGVFITLTRGGARIGLSPA